MQKRTLLATATLTALLISVGSLQAAPMSAETELAPYASSLQTMQTVETPAGPLWGEAWGWGFEWGVVSTLVCAPFIAWGAIACGITAAA